MALCSGIILPVPGAPGKATSPTVIRPPTGATAKWGSKLVVGIPAKPAKNGVFITIAYKRKLDKNGHLKESGIKRCDFISPRSIGSFVVN